MIWLLGLLALGGIGLAASSRTEEDDEEQQGSAAPPMVMIPGYPLPIPLPQPSGTKTEAHEGFGPGTAPQKHDLKPDQVLQWNRFAMGPRDDLEVYVGDLPPGEWTAMLYVALPSIAGSYKFGGKAGKKEYGWNDPPPNGKGVAQAVVKVVNGALGVVAPVGDAVASGYGVPPGVVTGAVKAVQKVLGLIPDAIERGRVKAWSEWREGERGTPVQREIMKDEVARWRDANGLHALQGAEHVGRWYWEGTTGELPLMQPPTTPGAKPIPIEPGYALGDQPSLSLEPKEGTDYQRVVLHLPPTIAVPGGERRYILVVRRA